MGADLMAPRLPTGGRLLHPGCGMSLLPLHLLNAVSGLEIVSVDGSPTCVNAMRESHGHIPRLSWEVCDVRALAGEALGASFDAAVEKGCLDALLCDSDSSAASYIACLARLLPAGGPLFLVSNSPVRHRHLTTAFEVREVLALRPDRR